MNKQEIFTKAYLGLRDQNFERSILDDTCMYRSPVGLKCALGHCIPDERYSPELEKKVPYFLTADIFSVALATPLDGDDIIFLRDLQDCHDTADSHWVMERNLDSFAKCHDLEIPS